MSAPPAGKSAVINPDQRFAMDAASGGAYMGSGEPVGVAEVALDALRVLTDRGADGEGSFGCQKG